MGRSPSLPDSRDSFATHMGSVGEFLLYQGISQPGKRMPTDPVPTFPPDHNAPAEWEVLSALIGDIYDSVLHPESWNDTLARITSEPAAILGIPAGSLAVGEAADICIFDPEESWCVTPENLRSQGKNIPFPGVEMKGRVKQTLIGGRLVFPF